MGTAKRERQKANRAKRDEEMARQAAKSKSTRLAVFVIVAIVAVFLIVVIAGQFIGDDEDGQGVIAVAAPAVVVSVEPSSS